MRDFGSSRRPEGGQRLRWGHIAGLAVGLSVHGFAVLYASLPPLARSPAHTSLDSAPEHRRALSVEFVEAVGVDGPELLDSPEREPVPPRLDRPSLPAPVVSPPAAEIASAAVPSPPLRLSVNGAQVTEAAAPAFGPMLDPKDAAAVFQRRPALTHEPTRFDEAWQPTSLAEKARQSSFYYARFCSLGDELRQAQGCSREERNAAKAAARGTRIDPSVIRPDAAVD